MTLMSCKPNCFLYNYLSGNNTACCCAAITILGFNKGSSNKILLVRVNLCHWIVLFVLGMRGRLDIYYLPPISCKIIKKYIPIKKDCQYCPINLLVGGTNILITIAYFQKFGHEEYILSSIIYFQ